MLLALGNDPQWVPHLLVELAVVVPPAIAGTATAPTGTAAMARMANAVRNGLRTVWITFMIVPLQRRLLDRQPRAKVDLRHW
jgi:hypothetical protein